jgi:hypothetical protein
VCCGTGKVSYRCYLYPLTTLGPSFPTPAAFRTSMEMCLWTWQLDATPATITITNPAIFPFNNEQYGAIIVGTRVPNVAGAFGRKLLQQRESSVFLTPHDCLIRESTQSKRKHTRLFWPGFYDIGPLCYRSHISPAFYCRLRRRGHGTCALPSIVLIFL